MMEDPAAPKAEGASRVREREPRDVGSMSRDMDAAEAQPL
jgi:hypothetical protein